MDKNFLFKKKLILLLITIVIFIIVLIDVNSYLNIKHNEIVYNNENVIINTSYNQSFFNMYYISDLGQVAYGATSADFDSDGSFDFAISSSTQPFNYSTISIFYNNGNLGFARHDVFTFNYSYIDDLDSGDYDNDGKIDLMFTCSESIPYENHLVYVNSTINILFNDGNNNFQNRTILARYGPGVPLDDENRIHPQLTSADYDIDGDIDFLVGDNSGKIEFFLNDGKGVFTSNGILHDFGSLSWGLTSDDFDGDGYIDLLVAAKSLNHSGQIYLKINNGFNTCFESDKGIIIEKLNSFSASLISLDYNNEENIDFIVGTESIDLFINNQDIHNSSSISKIWSSFGNVPDDFKRGALTSADYNNDGYDDFVAGGISGSIRLFINKGSRDSH